MKAAMAIPVLLLAVIQPAGLSTAQQPLGTRLLAEPAISGQRVAFVYDHDLWIADRDGSHPQRLTSHEGSESNPCFSPDGQLIAFSAEYDGNTDVYVIPASGGAPKRLTWHPAADNVEGFTPDGKSVLFSSPRNVFTNRYVQLFTVSLEGGFPTQLPIPNGLRAAYSPDGSKIAYIPISERFQQWKNYRGGTTSRIWIYDVADHSVQQIRQPAGRCNDTQPLWIGNEIYFRSDRNGEFNIFSFSPQTEAIRQVTEYADFPVDDVSGDGQQIIFDQAGYLHQLNPLTGEARQIPITVTTDALETRPRWVKGFEWIRGGDISPSGARAALEFRGEIVTVPAEKGDVRNVTQSVAVHERSPAWSPDGTKIAYFSDQDGEYRLHVAPQDGKGPAEVYEVAGHGFYENPQWSPDGTKISYIDNSWSLYVFDLAKKQSTRIGSASQFGPGPLRPLAHDWSHDSRWIAYTLNTNALIQQVFVYDVADDKSYPVTDGMSDVGQPVFDRSGKYLYLVASTDAGPVKHWFAMSNADMELSQAIYVAVLQNDVPSPLGPESDEEKPQADPQEKQEGGGAGADSPSDASDKPEEKEDKKLRIDFEGLDQRILALPLPAAVYNDLQAGPDETIYFIKRSAMPEFSPVGPAASGDSELQSFSLKTRKPTTLLNGASGFALSRDGKKLLYFAGNALGIAPAGAPIDRGSTQIATDKIQVRIDPRAEWEQIFAEVWRINRDYFYDPNMHGADWPAMREKYQPFLQHVITRDDLNRVIRWMCSELAVGHHYLFGGDQRSDVENVPGGLLGADFELNNGRYRFAKVLGGLNWNAQLRAPLTEPGVSIAAGEYLLRVNGRELTDKENVFEFFENTAGQAVELTVAKSADGSDSRTVTAVPIANDNALRNRDWVEGNLKKVSEATDGRVAYVYVPNTSNVGHEYFKRYFFPQVHKQAIIVDERFNGGGQVADYYIDHLRRPYICNWATRYGQDLRTPSGTILGPKVCLIDETAGSGGDLFPWMFHKLQIGPLVGKRTWGGLVGILGFPTLMDGGFVTAPNLAFWTEDGFGVENEGVPPDVEVEQWPAEVIAGRDPQLEKAIEIVLQQLDSDPPHSPRKPAYPIRVRK